MDREGRGEDRPGMLRAKIYPYEPDKDADLMLSQLHPKFVLRYEIAGKRYLQVNPESWKKHQRPHTTEGPSLFPPPNNASITQALPLSNASPTLWKGKGKGKGVEEREKQTDRAVGAACASFSKFWDSYPAKKAKKPAEVAWGRLNPDSTLLSRIMAALEAQKRTDQWQRGIIPNPSTWINQRRWEDETGISIAPARVVRKCQALGCTVSPVEGLSRDGKRGLCHHHLSVEMSAA